MGIEWLDFRCEESPTKAHWLMSKTQVDKGSIYMCKYCGKVRWMPNTQEGCYELGKLINQYGYDVGYQRVLDKHPAAKRLLSKVQDIYYLRKAVSGDCFAIAVAAIMLDREYPFDVTLTEEEIL